LRVVTTARTTESDAALCHGILLRLAGRLDDGTVAGCRAALGHGPTAVGPAVARLSRAVSAADLWIPSADRDFLRRVLTQSGHRPDLLGPSAETSVRQETPAYMFAPAAMDVLAEVGSRIGACLDLTSEADARISATLTDPADAAVVRRAAALPGAVGLWRAWRFCPRDMRSQRMFMLEVTSSPWEATAAVQAVAGDAGVEVFVSGSELPPYQAKALTYSALLWSAAPGGPVSIAAGLSPDAAVLADGDEVLTYLESGVPLAVTDATAADTVDPSQGETVPLGVRTDGSWIWSDAAGHYLRHYGLSPDPYLVAHIRSAGRRVPSVLDGVTLFRAMHRLQRTKMVTV
jgi:hypothetical protein